MFGIIAGLTIRDGNAIATPDTNPTVRPSFNWMMPPEKEDVKDRFAYRRGKSLYDLCLKSHDGCQVYIQGVVDGQLSMVDSTDRDISYCIPPGTSSAELEIIVVKSLKNHPEMMDELASILVARALAAVWPQCQ